MRSEPTRAELLAELQAARQKVAELEQALSQAPHAGAIVPAPQAPAQAAERTSTPSAAHASADNLRAFFNTIDHLLFVADLQGDILFTNQTVTRRLGFTAAELHGTSLLHVHPPEHRAEAAQIIAGLLNGTVDNCPLPLITKDGERIPAETRVVRGMWSGQEAIFGVTKDLSALKASEEKFNKAFHASPAPMGITDTVTGKYVAVNEVFLQNLGFERDEVVGKTATELELFVDPDQRAALLARMREQGFLRDESVLVRAKAGDIRHGMFSAEYIPMQDHTLLLTVMNDITSSDESAAALRQSEEQYRVLVDAMDISLCRWKPDTTLVYANDRYRRIFGMHGTGIGQRWLDFLPDATRAETAAFYRQLAVEPHTVTYTHAVTVEDGTLRHYQWTDTPIFDRAGLLVEFQSVGIDITERKQAEDNLLKNQQMLSDAQAFAQLQSWIADVETNTLELGPGKDNVLHLTPGTHRIDTLLALIHPDDRAMVATAWAQVADDRALDVECRVLLDSESKWLHTKARLVRDTAGGPAKVFAITQDITRRKQTEELVHAQRDLARIVATVTSAEKAWPRCLEVALRVTGMDSGGLYLFNADQTAIALVYHQGLSEAFVQAVAHFTVDTPNVQAILQGKTIYYSAEELANQPLSAREGLHTLAAIPIAHQGRMMGCINIASHSMAHVQDDVRRAIETLANEIGNIIVYLNAETALRKSEALLSEAQRIGRIGHWEWTAPGAELLCSDELFKLLELPQQGNTLPHSAIAALVKTKERDHLNNLDTGAFAGGKDLDYEFQIQLADGTERWLYQHAQVTYGDDGRPVRMLGIIQDVTERKQAEEELLRMEMRYKALIEHAPDGIILVSADGHMKYMSPSTYRLMGYQLGDIEGLDAVELVHPDDRTAAVDVFVRLLEDPTQTLNLQYRTLHHNGEWRWVDSTFSNLLHLPSVDAFVINFHDITERKRAEETLRESRARAQAMLNAIPDMMFRINREGVFLDYRADTSELYTQTERSLIGVRNRDVAPAEFGDLIEREIQATLASGALRTFEYHLDIPGQGNRTYEARMVPSGPDEVIAIVRNITVRKQTEQALQDLNRTLEARVRERTAELQDLYDNAPVGYHSVDDDGNLAMVNQTELNWLGYTRDEVVGRPMTALIAPATVDLFYHAFPILKQRGWIKDVELDFLRKDGTTLPVMLSATALYDQAGHFVASRTTVFDNTDRKAADEAQRRANQELEGALRMKDEFLANMSHELRTPLNGILAFSEILLEGIYGPLNERQQRSIRNVESSGRHLLALINDLLDLSKIEAGKLELVRETVLVEEICQASLVFVKEIANRKRIRLSYRNEELRAKVEADPRRLKQMLVNLLGNAVKFTPEGGSVQLSVAVRPAESVIQFAVQDSGPGIAAEDIPRLFQPFTQLDAALARQFEGTGLGLALVRRLAVQHGGAVEVTSAGIPGQGSCFTISLPYTTSEAPDAPAELTASQPGSDAPGASGAASPWVLLVEDNEVSVEALSGYLEFIGYRLLVARTGQEALAIVQTQPPDVILMDIQLPLMDGLEVTRRLRRDPQFAATPIIALTALAMPNDRARCLQAGATEYMSKPIRPRELAAMIQRLLDT